MQVGELVSLMDPKHKPAILLFPLQLESINNSLKINNDYDHLLVQVGFFFYLVLSSEVYPGYDKIYVFFCLFVCFNPF